MATVIAASGAYRPDEVPNLESSHSGITWSAIIGGAVGASAVSLILIALGAGLGLASVSPWANAGASAAAFGVGAGIWFLVVQWLSSAFGGYLAGRLRAKWAAPESDEVFFRDTSHGFLAWALATLIVAGFLGSAVSGVAGIGGNIAAGAAGGATQGAAQAAASPATESMLDGLFRPTQPTADSPGENARGEAGRIIAGGVTGTIDPADRTYLAQSIAARTGITQEEAEQRVDNAVATAKSAADTARKSASAASIMTALSLMVGAFIAAVAGALGGRNRDEI